MARPKNTVPSYKLHTSTGLARCWVGGKWVSLGKYNSPESRAEYARIVAELAVSGDKPRSPAGETGIPVSPTIDQILLRYLAYADQRYRHPDNTPTGHTTELKNAVKPLHRLYGHTLAKDFGPLALKAVRAEMVRLDWCRKQVNIRVHRIKQVFKWAVAEELVPVAVHTALSTVAALRAGRGEAREKDDIGPVAPALVDATLPHLGALVRGLVEFQRLTGCRPGEAIRVRGCDLDTEGQVWVYRLPRHKTAHKGKARAVVIGPKAQEVLRPFLKDDPEAYLFDPGTARGRYSAHTYRTAVRRACKRGGVSHWHPSQLRHTFATEVRKVHGLEAAQVLLGHSRADVTQTYAERNLTLALKVAGEVG